MNIFKYSLSPCFDSQAIYIPVGSYPMAVQLQDNEPVMWVCQPEDNSRMYHLRVCTVPTGHSVITNMATYLGTYQKNSLVYHVFYEIIS